MTQKEQIGAAIGLVVGVVAGYLFFNDADNAWLGTLLPSAILGVAAAFIGYFLVRDRGRAREKP